ncbi:hypothetical protein ACSTLH_00810, partial [Vibrio parahaemolyticus]
HHLVNVRTENILLRGKALSHLPVIKNAFLVIENGLIQAFGSMASLSNDVFNNKTVINANGATILPCWCDSHTHLVFAATREEEFIDKLKGL